MQKLYSLIFILIFGQLSINAQKLISAESIATFSAFQLTILSGIPVDNGVEQFKVRYEMDGIDGTNDTVSGLLVIPVLSNQEQLPLIVYQHPTSTNGRNDVPSSGGFSIGSVESIALSAFGFLVFSTDYLGLGESRGFHPFVHAATEVDAAINMMHSSLQYLDNQGGISWDSTNLFVAGYSQGGHASMALHQELEASYTDEFPVTAAAHMSGPYSLSGVMLEKFLSDVPTGNVSDMVFMLLGYQSAYQNIFESLSDIFKEPYLPIISNFYTNQYALVTLESQLSNALLQNEDTIVANRMLQPSFLEELNDPNSEIIELVRENDTFNWAPGAPTRLLYCSADERVPALNSTLADSVMNQLGAVDVSSIDINASVGHGDCTLFALLAAVDFFRDQLVTVSIEKGLNSSLTFKVFPNPAQDYIYIEGTDQPTRVEIYSISGQVISRTPFQWNNTVDLSILTNGMYYLKIWTKDSMEVHPLQVQR